MRVTDAEAQEIIRKLSGAKNIVELKNMAKEDRDRNLSVLRENGLSIRQISRLTGISFSIIRKI